MIDFIGIGAQKSGTSWVYACLYEHPEICAPIKEIHFFSRPRYAKGRAWYEAHFKKCAPQKKTGEFSTSYLYSKEAPARIHDLYPDTKLIALLRNPVDRAYSQYRNACKAGEIDATLSFESYAEKEPSVLEQGRYAEQLARYRTYFDERHMLVLRYEASKEDPLAFIQSIYAFLGVDDTFVPSMVHRHINVARAPRAVWVEKSMHTVAESMRRVGLDRLVHRVRQWGIPDLVRRANTKETQSVVDFDREQVQAHFIDDVARLSEMTGYDFTQAWNIQ